MGQHEHENNSYIPVGIPPKLNVDKTFILTCRNISKLLNGQDAHSGKYLHESKIRYKIE